MNNHFSGLHFFCHLANDHASNARQTNGGNIDKKMNDIKRNNFSCAFGAIILLWGGSSRCGTNGIEI
jgi:hypothetical protein